MPAARPNILLILVDCLRSDRVAAIAPTKAESAIAALKRRGTTFNRLIATASTTSPAVMSLLTGLYPTRHGVRTLSGARLAPGVTTLAQWLHDAGYTTNAFVTGPLRAEVGLASTFDRYEHREKTAYLDSPSGEAITEQLHGGLDPPWFALIHLWELHDPMHTPPAYRGSRYGPRPYDAALTALDAHMVRLLNGLPENTIVILTGDHGENLVRAARLKKRAAGLLKHLGIRFAKRRIHHGHGFGLYEALIRVPLIIRAGDRLPAGVEIDTIVRQIDIAPTVAELVGVQPPPDLDGETLIGLATGSAPRENRLAYMEAVGITLPNPSFWKCGLLRDNVKYIRSLEEPVTSEELYDLDADPMERRDLVGADPSLLAEMRALLEKEIRRQKSRAAAMTPLSEQEQEALKAHLADLGYV